MENQEKVFANGFFFKRNEKAPDFVIGNISIKSEDAIKFIQDYTKNGWVNLKINKSQGGKTYIELDTWEKSKTSDAIAYKKEPVVPSSWIDPEIVDQLPF
jgi:hypothetical protein